MMKSAFKMTDLMRNSRSLLALSAAGMALSAAALSVCTRSAAETAAETAEGSAAGACSGGVLVGVLIVYIFSFGVGVGPLAFVIVSGDFSFNVIMFVLKMMNSIF